MTSLARPAPAPPTYLGAPLAHWAFGLRTWLAMMLALYAAFWLELGSASSAATCVGILALPVRGQAYQKALYRFLGTLAGIVASLVVAGLFNETRDLFFLAFAGWMALCVFAASKLDGNRAYGAVLSGYTVAIVAVAEVDAPQATFTAGVNRGAAILVGIVAVGLVNDAFSAPDLRRGLETRLAALHRKVRAFVLDTVREGVVDPVATAALMGEITALHPDVTAVLFESIGGPERAAAARRAVSALVREVRAAGALVSTFAACGEGARAWAIRLPEALRDDGGDDAARLIAECDAVFEETHAAHALVIAARGARGILVHDRAVVEAREALRTGARVPGPRLPIYRSNANAARNALRIFIAVLVATTLLALSGWASTSFALVQIASTAGLAATNPNPKRFALGACIAMPIAAIVAGVTEFLVLDGADAFPLLAIAMLPPVVIGCLLIASGNPLLLGIGFMNVVFFPVLLSPTNPQDYNPQSYLTNSVLAVTAVISLFVVLAVVLPTDDALRRRWMLGSLHDDLREAAEGRGGGRRPDAEASFRSADRLGQLAALTYASETEKVATLRHAVALAEITFAARWVGYTLGALGRGEAARARRALAALEPTSLRALADELTAPPSEGARTEPARRWAAANLARTAALIERNAADVALAQRGALP